MKKILVTVAVALMAAMGVNAQNEELRHEVSVFYGGPSISHLGSAFGELVGLVFTNAEYDDGKIFGPIGGEYFYHCNNPRLAIGGIVTYSKWDSDVLRRNSSHDMSSNCLYENYMFDNYKLDGLALLAACLRFLLNARDKFMRRHVERVGDPPDGFKIWLL